MESSQMAQHPHDDVRVRSRAAKPGLVLQLPDLGRREARADLPLLGLSPRGGMALMSAAKANAWMLGRDHVLPDDVHQVFVAVAGHRLIPADSGTGAGSRLARKILETVDVVI